MCWKESKYSNENYRKVRQGTQDRTSRTEPVAKAIRTCYLVQNTTFTIRSSFIHRGTANTESIHWVKSLEGVTNSSMLSENMLIMDQPAWDPTFSEPMQSGFNFKFLASCQKPWKFKNFLPF